MICADCKEKLNPMWALQQLSRAEHRYHELHARYHDELKRLGERSRTKCQHCDQMTRISRSWIPLGEASSMRYARQFSLATQLCFLLSVDYHSSDVKPPMLRFLNAASREHTAYLSTLPTSA